MAQRFSNEQDWFTTGWGLAVWAAHFTLLWAASIVFPGQPAGRWAALPLTLAATGALIWLWRRAAPLAPLSVPWLGLGIAGAAIAFNAITALIA